MSKATYVPPGCETGVIIGQKAEIDRLRARIERLENALDLLEAIDPRCKEIMTALRDAWTVLDRAALSQGETK